MTKKSFHNTPEIVLTDYESFVKEVKGKNLLNKYITGYGGSIMFLIFGFAVINLIGGVASLIAFIVSIICFYRNEYEIKYHIY